MARIGFVAALFNRGLSEVSRNLADALSDLGHEIHWFVRQGMVYGQPMRERFGRWALPNRTDWPDLEIQPPALQSWAQYYGLKVVVFNEESQFALAMVLQQAGVKTIHYIDAYLSQAQRPYMRFFDQLWAVTARAEGILQAWRLGAKTQRIGWGVQRSGFAPLEDLNPSRTYDFMTSQGWLGLDCRKGLDTILWALEHQPIDGTPPEILVHCQLPQEQALQVIGWDRPLPPHIVWENGDHPPPGLYHLGRVGLQPSKIEGFGLSVVEAMGAGRPVITVDAPPMNEFVTDACGWLVPPVAWKPHIDGSIYEQALIDPCALWKVMQEAQASSDTQIRAKTTLTMLRARELFDWDAFTARLAQGLERLNIV